MLGFKSFTTTKATLDGVEIVTVMVKSLPPQFPRQAKFLQRNPQGASATRTELTYALIYFTYIMK